MSELQREVIEKVKRTNDVKLLTFIIALCNEYLQPEDSSSKDRQR